MPAGVTFIITGLLLGLTGLIPGPLFTLVVSETLKHGIKEGAKVAASPLVTDLPIIIITVFILSGLSGTDHVLGIISFAGGAFLIYLAFESLSFRGVGIDSTGQKSRSMRKGIVANFLNPSPYIFWFSIGAPTIVKAFKEGIIPASLFVIVFYLTLIGSMVVIALVTGKSKHFLSSRYYMYLIRFLGIVLLLFALFFIKNGLHYFDIV